ncbi:steroid 17-alpha-hydroxylase/17,20 lyase-like [Pomacea canaliculata]|uniref:steroid 17-alpha-hydroxylase/17,20 lyase-like n=1 Tax=Pomacea canaliculata TaxID=400727 RepID=UPI000D72C018|nr:steroid 17-alpha-hydroxylase/17,20 lyase-like [Pomacea canaliculata]
MTRERERPCYLFRQFIFCVERNVWPPLALHFFHAGCLLRTLVQEQRACTRVGRYNSMIQSIGIVGAVPAGVVCAASCVVVLIVVLLRRLTSRQQDGQSSGQTAALPLPPGPRGAKAVLSLLRGITLGNFHLEAQTWAPPCTPISMCTSRLGSFVSINHPDLVREAFAGRHTESITNDRPETFIGKFLFYGYKDIGFTSITPEWFVQRKMFHSALRLYGDGVQRFESTVQEEVRRLMEELEQCLGEDVYIEEHLSFSLLCILSILLTGERPAKDSPVPTAIRQLDRAISTMGTPSVDTLLRFLPWLRLVPGWFRRQCHVTRESRDYLIDTIVSRAQATVSADHPRGIVDALLLAQRAGGLRVTDDHVKGLILDIVVGGYVTSLTSFLSTLIVFLNCPHVVRSIQAEIDDVIGQKTPTLEYRKDLHYTEATLLEVLRFMRVFPLGLPHLCQKATEIGGYHIPKGTLLFANQWHSSRSDVWEKADSFLPERFLDEKGRLLSADHPTRRNLLPFGVGKRACPGEKFARSRLFLLVTTLLQRFDFLPPSDGRVIPLDDVPWVQGAVLLPPPFKCRVQRRVT